MKTIYRYVIQEILPTFFLCALALTALLMVNKIFLLMDLILNKHIPWIDTVVLYASLIPFVLSLTIPMSMMVGTLLAFGRLSSDMEVTAFKGSGVHLFHLISPVLAVGAVLTVFMLFFNDRILPAANYLFKETQFKILQKQANIAIREKMFITQFDGYQFYIDHQDRNGLFDNVKVFNRWSPRASVQTTLAKTGELETNDKNLQVFFRLDNGNMTWDNLNYQTYNRLYFDHYTIHLKLENQLANLADTKKDFEEMNLNELKNEMDRTTDPQRTDYIRTEFQKRIALPFACLAVAWFCAPLGLWIRSKGFIGFIVGIVMIFLYYLMFILGEICSQRGIVSPVVGLWGANAVMALAGCILYYAVVSEMSIFRGGGRH